VIDKILANVWQGGQGHTTRDVWRCRDHDQFEALGELTYSKYVSMRALSAKIETKKIRSACIAPSMEFRPKK
jgi:hypothetical protein